jgi:two-component system nitrogen regulation response regulator GlnG/two-component system response regulator HydG
VKSVKAETTISVAGEPLSPGEHESKDVPVLVVAWSAEEPARIGEFVGRLGEALVLGRGDDGEPDRVRFFRQRPQELVDTGPAGGGGISRKQLVLRRFAAGIEVEQVGRCALLVNGAPVSRAAVTAGDTIHLRGQLLLFCAVRPMKLPAARYFPEDAWGPFGEPDALGMLGESPAMWRLRDRLAFAAKSASHVLLRGESGTGKELAALAIHRLSARAAKPLVSRNAATFPSGLVDAELFGNVKNYPNPGTPERPGLIGQAHGGTLFLDEIGELPQEMQAHLLRVLDEGGDYQRLGEATARKSDLRLIGATNRPAESLKHDLLARLPVRIELDSLVDRREDIPLLVRHLVLRAADKSPEVGARFVARTKGRPEPRVDAALIDAMLRRTFGTNVRELDALLWNAMSESHGDALALTDAIANLPRGSAGGASPAPAPNARPARDPTAGEIRECVERENGNVRRAAAALGLPSRYALYRLMRKHGIDVKNES